MESLLATTCASAALFFMSFSSMILAVLFRSKFKKLNNLSKGSLAANIFNKTFAIFDPHSGPRKIIHNYLPLWAFMAGFASFTASLVSFLLVGMGFALTIFAVMAGLGLIVMDDAFDVYKNSKIFANAISGGSSIGVGDLKVFSILKVYTRRLSYYYLGVAALLASTSLALPYILDQALLAFSWIIEGILQASSIAGFANWQLGVLLFSMLIVLFEILIMKVKSRIFKI
jgi:hypothetical protein